jgi:hypothetical protein
MTFVVAHIVYGFSRFIEERLHGLNVADGIVTFLLTREGRRANVQEVVDAVSNISGRTKDYFCWFLFACMVFKMLIKLDTIPSFICPGGH